MASQFYAYLLTFWIITYGTGLQIIRGKLGDQTPGLSCRSGTLIVRDDATHSLHCAKSLSDAGCDLRFSQSHDIRCIEAETNNNINQYEILPSSHRDSFCGNGESVTTDIMLQDYPNNYQTPVWYTGHGISKIKKSFVYTTIKYNKINFRVTEVWPGLVFKVLVRCNNQTHKEVLSRKSKRRCVILKNIGYIPYPLAEHSFIQPTTAATTRLLTLTSAYVADKSNEDGNEEIAFAMVSSAGAVFIVVCICLTVACIVKMRSQRGKDIEKDAEKFGEDNVGLESDKSYTKQPSSVPENIVEMIIEPEPEDHIEENIVDVKENIEGYFYDDDIPVNEENDLEIGISMIVTKERDKKIKKIKFPFGRRKRKGLNQQRVLQFSPILSMDTIINRREAMADSSVIAMQEIYGTEESQEGYHNGKEELHVLNDIPRNSSEWENNGNSLTNGETAMDDSTFTSPTAMTFSEEQESILTKFAQEYNAVFSESDDINIYAHVLSANNINKGSKGGKVQTIDHYVHGGDIEQYDDGGYHLGHYEVNMTSPRALNETYVIENGHYQSNEVVYAQVNKNNLREYVSPNEYENETEDNSQTDLTEDFSKVISQGDISESEDNLHDTSQENVAEDLSESIEAMFDLSEDGTIENQNIYI